MSARKLLRFGAAGACLTLLLSTTSGAATMETRKREASRFVAKKQQANGSIPSFSAYAGTADAIIGLRAARYAPKVIDEAVNFLKRKQKNIVMVGEKAKVVLALVAAEKNPRSFAGRNLIAELKATLTPGGVYESLIESQVYDQALAILALRGAKVRVPRKAMAWLANAQCDDGGWQFDQPSAEGDDEHCSDPTNVADYTGSDTNTTALAVMAFNARPSTVPLAHDAFDFFATARDEVKGGWVYDPRSKCSSVPEPGDPYCGITDANSTSLVLQAHFAEGAALPSGSFAALKRLQHNASDKACLANGGAFAYTWDATEGGLRRGEPDVGATVAGLTALTRRPLPVDNTGDPRPLRPRNCS